VSSVTYVSIKSLVLRWPGHMQLIKALKANRKIVCNYAMMRRLFPNWGRRSMMGFLKHYQVLRDCEAMCITNSYRLMIWDCTLKDTPPGTPSERFTHVMLHLLPKCTAELTFGEFVVAL